MSTETGGGMANLMLALQGLQGTSELASSYGQASAQRAQGRYEAGRLRAGAEFAEMEAEDVTRRGDEAAQERLRQARALISRQRVAAAGQGLDVSAGTPLDIQADTAAAGAVDAETIRLNAFREAWGLRMEAADRRGAARNVRSGSRFAARQTIAGGGLAFGRNVIQGAAYYEQFRPITEEEKKKRGK